MEKIIITIETTNAAFDDGSNAELARILRELAARIERGEMPSKLRDYNGNTCGVIDVE